MFKEDEEVVSAHDPPALDVDDDGRVLLASARELVAGLDALVVSPPSADAVRADVARQAAWEERTAAICADAAAWEQWHVQRSAAGAAAAAAAAPPKVDRLTVHELAAHIAVADKSRFSCAQADTLRALLNQPAEALSALRRTLTKKSATQKMDRCVAVVAQSAAAMRAAAARALRTAPAAADAPELNCLCQQVRSALLVPLPHSTHLPPCNPGACRSTKRASRWCAATHAAGGTTCGAPH
jgi:hypothetical protein